MKEIIVYSILFCVMVLFNARVYYLVKIKQDDPLKVLKPFWVINDEEKKEYEETMNRG